MHASTSYAERPPAVDTSHVDDPRTRSEQTSELLQQAAGQPPERRRQLLEHVVLLNMAAPRSVARRYRNRGIAAEDLDQVAYVALVRAADKFDAALDKDFLTYAVPLVSGEIKKHFRDHGWVVRPPRRTQALQPQVGAAGQELTRSMGRSPRPSEIAARLGVDVEDVVEALAMDGCFRPA